MYYLKTILEAYTSFGIYKDILKGNTLKNTFKKFCRR